MIKSMGLALKTAWKLYKRTIRLNLSKNMG